MKYIGERRLHSGSVTDCSSNDKYSVALTHYAWVGQDQIYVRFGESFGLTLTPQDLKKLGEQLVEAAETVLADLSFDGT